jgi:beta-ureidopropionase
MNRRRFLTGTATTLGLAAAVDAFGAVDAQEKADAGYIAETPSTDQLIRVGLIQMNGTIFEKEYNFSRAEKLIRLAAGRGAKLMCTPEVAVQGYARVRYPQGMSFDDPQLVAERGRILSAAEPIPGPATARFAALARELGVWIVFGMDENRSGRLFNTAVLMDPEGSIVGLFSKVHLQNWMQASGVNHGEGFPVWDVEIDGVKTKLGIAICEDVTPVVES